VISSHQTEMESRSTPSKKANAQNSSHSSGLKQRRETISQTYRSTHSGRPKRLRSRPAHHTNEGSRSRVKTACTNCKLAKARCDNGRPCSRCVKRGCQSTCVDAVPKRRGRKRVCDMEALDNEDSPEKPEKKAKTQSVKRKMVKDDDVREPPSAEKKRKKKKYKKQKKAKKKKTQVKFKLITSNLLEDPYSDVSPEPVKSPRLESSAFKSLESSFVDEEGLEAQKSKTEIKPEPVEEPEPYEELILRDQQPYFFEEPSSDGLLETSDPISDSELNALLDQHYGNQHTTPNYGAQHTTQNLLSSVPDMSRGGKAIPLHVDEDFNAFNLTGKRANENEYSNLSWHFSRDPHQRRESFGI
jgi:hypothetical protein